MLIVDLCDILLREKSMDSKVRVRTETVLGMPGSKEWHHKREGMTSHPLLDHLPPPPKAMQISYYFMAVADLITAGGPGSGNCWADTGSNFPWNSSSNEEMIHIFGCLREISLPTMKTQRVLVCVPAAMLTGNSPAKLNFMLNFIAYLWLQQRKSWAYNSVTNTAYTK